MTTPARAFGPFLLLAAALASFPALAEKADRDRDAFFTADSITHDDLRQVTVGNGHVVLTKGTMRLAGDHMEHRQDELGYQHYRVTVDVGGLASFHERRDPPRPGVEATVDGVAEVIDYDERTDTVHMERRAVVRRFENGELHDELSGERIVYDTLHSTYEVDGHAQGQGAGRVQMRISPSKGGPAPQPGAAPPPAGGGR